ncbi:MULTISPECIES: hypothetical protein [Pseudoalteromonas]|jgi:hypothetical protein|uniref:hypothetical protein n=1 Tax=Pseudoalteromonas TaxID=53246 RepID=UPI00110CD3C7|nr:MULTISPECIES: hypothetical protein [Pseudoalteromonas]TMS81727.1 hypothetical protein CWB65_08640 [Pseudoalteromonas sp. S554]
MLVDILIKNPDANVKALTKQMDLQSELKRQHQAAFVYRLKRFAASKVGLSSAFIAGVAVQSGKSETSLIRKYGWLLRLIG